MILSRSITDKAVVKWPTWCIMQISTLLRLKHCLWRHIERTSRNEFKRRFSHFLATFRATIGSASQQTLRTAVCSKEFKMATKQSGQRDENYGQFAAALSRTETKLMWKYEHLWYLAETCHVYSYNVKEKCIKFPAISGIFWILAAAWSYRALQKNSTSVSQEKFIGYCREFKGKWTI